MGARLLVIAMCLTLLAAADRATTASGQSASARATAPTTSPVLYRTYLDTDRVGLKQDISINIKYQRQRSLRRNEQVTSNDAREFTIEFDGSVEVLAAEGGEATKLSLVVERLVLNENGKTEEILPSGSIVIVESNDKAPPRFSLADGGEIDRSKLWYVQSLTSVKREGEPSGTEIYGRTSPQPVGATWPISTRQLARSYATQNIAVDQNRSGGETRFVATEQRDGETYAHIESTVNIEMKVPAAKGWKQTAGEARLGFAVLAPTEAGHATLDSSSFYESTTKFLRYVGRNETEREVSEDHIVRFRQVKVRRTHPATTDPAATHPATKPTSSP